MGILGVFLKHGLYNLIPRSLMHAFPCGLSVQGHGEKPRRPGDKGRLIFMEMNVSQEVHFCKSPYKYTIII